MPSTLITRPVGDGLGGNFSGYMFSDNGALNGNCNPGTIIMDVNRIPIDWTAPVPVVQSGIWNIGQSFYTLAAFNRPANVTPYPAGSVIGGSVDLGVLGLNASNIEILGTNLRIDIPAIPVGMTNLLLQLYSSAPPSAFTNATVWDLQAGDRASYLGVVDLGTPVDAGATLYVDKNAINKPVKLTGTDLFAYLVTVGGFTPANNSEIYNVGTHTLTI